MPKTLGWCFGCSGGDGFTLTPSLLIRLANGGDCGEAFCKGFPDYGFYSAPSDQRGAPCSFADYGSLGPQAAQMLQSEHATSACNSPLQHLHSPDQFKSPGLYGAFLS
ncbi:RNA-binding protein Musashi homolog 2a isoform X1 [Tachysurus ichikawai]